MMKHIFGLIFRLFLAFLAAKLIAAIFGLPSLEALLGLTALVLANIFLFDYLDYRSRSAWRRPQSWPRLWKRRQSPKATPPATEESPPES